MSETQNPTSKLEFIANGLLAIPYVQLLQQDGELLPDAVEPTLSQEQALKIYKTMRFIRILDQRMIAAQRQGRLSFYLACTGEEAATVASAAALDDNDMIMAQYREQGALAYRGFSIDQFMNNNFSNAKDPQKGRQMPIHYGSDELNYMTISSPLGTQIPQASGYAYGQKLAGNRACTICYFGEGAASEGDFHAGLNMAAVLNAPVIFFCRNNGYAISTPASEQFKGDGIASRGIGYGIKTIRIDGNDALAVYAATKQAREIAVENNEPVLIEAMTYRLAAHSTSDDPSGYRSKKEEQLWAQKDPIERFKLWLISKGYWDESQEKDYMDSTRQDVLDSMKRCEKNAIAPLSEIVTDVYDQVPWHLQEQIDELKSHIAKYPEAYPKTSGSL